MKMTDGEISIAFFWKKYIMKLSKETVKEVRGNDLMCIKTNSQMFRKE